MRTETYTIPEQTVTEEIYEYDELDEDAKETVKEMLSEQLHDNDVFHDDCRIALLDAFPNSNLDVSYSISYVQSDFLTIYGEVSLIDLLNNMSDEGGNDLTQDDRNYLQWAFTYEGGNPMHKIYGRDEWIDYNDDYAYDVEYDIDYDATAGDEEVLKHGGDKEDVFEKFNNASAQYLESFAHSLYDSGYDYFMYECTDEDAEEICYNEGYEFDEDGNLTYIDGEEV